MSEMPPNNNRLDCAPPNCGRTSPKCERSLPKSGRKCPNRSSSCNKCNTSPAPYEFLNFTITDPSPTPSPKPRCEKSKAKPSYQIVFALLAIYVSIVNAALMAFVILAHFILPLPSTGVDFPVTWPGFTLLFVTPYLNFVAFSLPFFPSVYAWVRFGTPVHVTAGITFDSYILFFLNANVGQTVSTLGASMGNSSANWCCYKALAELCGAWLGIMGTPLIMRTSRMMLDKHMRGPRKEERELGFWSKCAADWRELRRRVVEEEEERKMKDVDGEKDEKTSCDSEEFHVSIMSM